ncbi:MAG: clpP2 [Mucilaginibacter sp.]|nr:clpP2 [Mucilaginibacter sp.]
MAYKIYLYDNDSDCIGSGNLSSQFVQYQLEAAAGQDVEVHISSVGGSAFDAIAIYDLLKKYQGIVTTHVDALAASAASIVAMAGKTVFMGKYALMMIHKPMVGSGGNADELMKDVEMLNIVQTRLAAIYIDKTGLDEVTVNSLINSVTWLSADQALDLGFIDQIEEYDESTKVTNSVTIRKFTGTAPAFYQRVINKILSTENTPNPPVMNIENKELIEKTNSVLDKIMNFFKKSIVKTVTNSATLYHTGPIAVGTKVFNDEGMEDKAKDGDHEVDNQVITVLDGTISNVVAKQDPEPDPNKDDDNDPDEEDTDPEDKVVLNALKLKGVKKDDRKDVTARLKDIKNKLVAQNALLADAKTALEEANARLAKTREEVKNEIESDFTPEGSKRSNKTRTEPQPFFAPTTDLAKNAVSKAVTNSK